MFEELTRCVKNYKYERLSELKEKAEEIVESYFADENIDIALYSVLT